MTVSIHWLLGLAIILAALAQSAAAQTYHVLAGSLSGEALTGEISVRVDELTSVSRTLHVTDFTLHAGDRTFALAPQLESRIDLVGIQANAVLRAGDLELRSGAQQANYSAGALGDGAPRRLHLAGSLYEVERTDRITTETAVGEFALVATAARPIPIDVRPAQPDNVLLPGARGHVAVAILAARPLDACPIDGDSLRLGDGEAAPMPWSGREPTRERDVDGDGAPDLLARFRVRETGIAFGDDALCLVARTTCGELLEGCDAIQTLQRL